MTRATTHAILRMNERKGDYCHDLNRQAQLICVREKGLLLNTLLPTAESRDWFAATLRNPNHQYYSYEGFLWVFDGEKLVTTYSLSEYRLSALKKCHQKTKKSAYFSYKRGLTKQAKGDIIIVGKE